MTPMRNIKVLNIFLENNSANLVKLIEHSPEKPPKMVLIELKGASLMFAASGCEMKCNSVRLP